MKIGSYELFENQVAAGEEYFHALINGDNGGELSEERPDSPPYLEIHGDEVILVGL